MWLFLRFVKASTKTPFSHHFSPETTVGNHLKEEPTTSCQVVFNLLQISATVDAVGYTDGYTTSVRETIGMIRACLKNIFWQNSVRCGCMYDERKSKDSKSKHYRRNRITKTLVIRNIGKLNIRTKCETKRLRSV